MCTAYLLEPVYKLQLKYELTFGQEGFILFGPSRQVVVAPTFSLSKVSLERESCGKQ